MSSEALGCVGHQGSALVGDRGRAFTSPHVVKPPALGYGSPIAGELAKALREIHSRGRVHGDLKPDNIIVRPSTAGVRIIDFGTARGLDGQWQRGGQPSGAFNDLAIARREAKQSLDLLHEIAHDKLSNSYAIEISCASPPISFGDSISATCPSSWSAGFNGFTPTYAASNYLQSFLSDSVAQSKYQVNNTGLSVVAALMPFLSAVENARSLESILWDWQERQERQGEEYREAVATEILAEAIEQRPAIAMYLNLNEVHAGFLVSAVRGTLKITILAARIVCRVIVCTFTFLAFIAAVIFTFMSHRHRHEPADGSLLVIKPILIAGGVQ